MGTLSAIIPPWLSQWLRVYAIPFLKIEGRKVLSMMLQGMGDALLFIGLPLTLSLGSQAVWNARYHLTPEQQQQVASWASISALVAYLEDVPPVVPLTLWYKEGGLQATNPDNCEGIMGMYTAIRTGQQPCFPPGPISAWEVAYQLRLGARTFKEYCPDVHYTTTDPALLKRCYLYYNAGPASQANPDQSAYVMNGYDVFHQNMTHTDVQGRSYRLQALGAWPVHLAIQAQLAQDNDQRLPPYVLAPALLGQEMVDKLWVTRTEINGQPTPEVTPTRCRAPQVTSCLVAPHTDGAPDLAPQISPLHLSPAEIGEATCGLLPSVALVPPQSSLVLSPITGTLTRYTDLKGHLAVQIENEEWSVWLTGLRSYTAPPGPVKVGQPVGAVGGMDSSTPALHYAIYDKRQTGFVDPLGFLPAESCPPAG